MPADLPCVRARGDGAVLLVSVMPNAKRTAVDGMHDGALRIRLAAPPIDGRANAALTAWLARSIGVKRRDVELLRGDGSRRKQIAIAAPLEVVRAWIERELAAGL